MPANDRPWDKKSRDDDDDDRTRRRPRDEDDEGEDDRPRRRRPRDERNERDEDDRPRRQPRDERDEDDRPRRRPRDEDDDYEHDRPRERPQPSNGLAIAGLILGILAFCTVGLTGIPALICSGLALRKPTGRGLAVAGLLTGGLGTLAGIGLAVFIFMKAGSASERMRDSNNMKRLGFAMHGQHDSTGRMTAPFAQDGGQVNRNLSFRVGLLPYIEQDNLYKQFDKSQAWDSPKNQQYSNIPIATFTSPYGAERASTQTPYRVFYGGGALFNEDGKPTSFAFVSDGTSNTIMMVHAAEHVPWAAPRELLYNPTGPLPQLWAKDMTGTQILMADGSVRFVSKNVSERTLRNAITRSGGEVLGEDW